MIEHMKSSFEIKKGIKLIFEPCKIQLIRNVEKDNKNCNINARGWMRPECDNINN